MVNIGLQEPLLMHFPGAQHTVGALPGKKKHTHLVQGSIRNVWRHSFTGTHALTHTPMKNTLCRSVHDKQVHLGKKDKNRKRICSPPRQAAPGRGSGFIFRAVTRFPCSPKLAARPLPPQQPAPRSSLPAGRPEGAAWLTTARNAPGESDEAVPRHTQRDANGPFLRTKRRPWARGLPGPGPAWAAPVGAALPVPGAPSVCPELSAGAQRQSAENAFLVPARLGARRVWDRWFAGRRVLSDFFSSPPPQAVGRLSRVQI